MKSISSIKAKFERSNIEAESTKLWDKVSIEKSESILKEIDSLPNEQIALSYYQSSSYWWIITTNRLIVFENKKTNSFNFNDLTKIGLNEIFQGEATKKENSTIDIEALKEKFQLRVEKGTWHVIYNILKFLTEPSA